MVNDAFENLFKAARRVQGKFESPDKIFFLTMFSEEVKNVFLQILQFLLKKANQLNYIEVCEMD